MSEPNSAISSVVVVGTFSGEPNSSYGLKFFFIPEIDFDLCSNKNKKSLDQLPFFLKTDEKGLYAFRINLAIPLEGGFINCIAFISSRAASPPSPCVRVIEPTCPPSISPITKTFDAGEGTANINVASLAPCNNVIPKSGSEWITIVSAKRGNNTDPLGSIDYTVTENAEQSLRIGTITVDDKVYTVTQAGSGMLIPLIKSAFISDKNLIVTGEHFEAGAVVVLKGNPQKTKNNAEDPNILVCKKTGKKIPKSETVTLQVKNRNGLMSSDYAFTRQE
jgi:hypothetical protein